VLVKLSAVTLIGGTLLLVGCLFSQTRVPPDQIRPQSINGVFVNVTGKGVVLATVDPATLVLDTTGATPVLRALPQTAPVINEKHVSLKPAVGTTSVTILDAGYIPASLNVYVNGVLQSMIDDYTVAGTTVTLVRVFDTGDIVQLTYRF
jgi:hypothetical protein